MTDSKIQRLSGALFGFCGAAGAGKDTAAALLPGARTLAFADVLYEEAAAAFGVTVGDLKDRAGKEVVQDRFRGIHCRDEDEDFLDFLANRGIVSLTDPRSPRQILQWWGDYRRAQDPDYFVKRTSQQLIDWGWASGGRGTYVLTDCRFANEVALLRTMGGKLVQVVRPGVVAGGTGHASDTDGSQFAPDHVLHNSGSLEDLRAAVQVLQELKNPRGDEFAAAFGKLAEENAAAFSAGAAALGAATRKLEETRR